MKKILIIGGTGFIGYHIAKKAIKKKWKVTSISTNKPKKIRAINKVKYLICDISKKNKIKRTLKNLSFDYVINLGGYVNHAEKRKTYLSHFIGFKNLIEYFDKLNIKAFVQAGSSVEYGFNKAPQNEKMTFRINKTTSVYGKSKILSSNLGLKKFKNSNFPITIVRFYLVFGPRQDKNRFIPIIINGCLKNKKFNCSSGKQLRDFIYIDDVVSAIFKILNKKKARGEIFNLGSGKPKKLKNIIEFVKNYLKLGNPQYGLIRLRKDEPLKLYPSIRKAKKFLSWKPQINFFTGLKKTIKYYQNG